MASSVPDIAELRRPLPRGRSLEQLWNHFGVERALAASLKTGNRKQRKVIYETMYDELFRQVPDHPRLTQKADPVSTARANQSKLALIEEFLGPDAVIAEFAPGDCLFGIALAPRVKHVYGIEIADQRSPSTPRPDNFELIIYDGYDTSAIPEGSLDLIFSDQLIEHFHPEDTEQHFRLAHRFLKKGGCYVFRTPHWLTGPHDVSAYFSDEPLGFHLKEWLYGEIAGILGNVGYSDWHGYWCAKGRKIGLPFAYFKLCESALGALPKARARPLAEKLIREIVVVARK